MVPVQLSTRMNSVTLGNRVAVVKQGGQPRDIRFDVVHVHGQGKANDQTPGVGNAAFRLIQVMAWEESLLAQLSHVPLSSRVLYSAGGIDDHTMSYILPILTSGVLLKPYYLRQSANRPI